MRWQIGPVAVVAVLTIANTAGCAEVVDGSPHRAHPAADPDRSYGYVDNRCGLLRDETIQEMLDADHLVRPYSGAVCQYVLARGGSADPQWVDVTFSWFETGDLDRERRLAEDRGATVTDTDIERHKAFLARRDTTGVACSATAAAGSGVVSWWVQLRGESTGDPCADAEELLSATLNSDL